MPDQTDHFGMAALSICEALLLALHDHGLLPDHEIVGVLRDAAATHENAVGPESGRAAHRAAADLISKIMIDGKSIYTMGVDRKDVD